MNERFSPGLERVLTRARLQSQNAGHTNITFGELWKALLEDEDSHPAVALVSVGIDRDRFLEKVDLLADPESFRISELLNLAEESAFRHGADATITALNVMNALLEQFANHLISSVLDARDVQKLCEFSLDAPRAPIELSEPLQAFDLTAEVQTARVLDANLNRAREAMRVLDDYFRFALNDAFSTQTLKELRHRLAEASHHLPKDTLRTSRDTNHDVGTTITTGSEYSRHSLLQLAEVNFKRLQESLRSLEEFGKLISTTFAGQIEQIRYSAYELERCVLQIQFNQNRLDGSQLYLLVTRANCRLAMDWTIQEAVAGGVSIVQLREKNMADRELIDLARNVRRWTEKAGAFFIINDRPDIARLVGADGVHLGQDDLEIHEARKIVGSRAIIGQSTHNLVQLREAIASGADYVGVGPTFKSTTKQFETFSGLQFVQDALSCTSLPAFAIGGINLETIDSVCNVGATRVAISAAIADSDEPRQVAVIILEKLRRIRILRDFDEMGDPDN
jgi:thiamine-phosphate pyrophosphorylase